MKRSGAQIIIEQLCAHGVTTVFGYPGSAVLPLYDELYKNAHRIRHIITAHEQGAAHAADGYARSSGKTGVVITTSGPGATNIVTGIANAYLDSVPLVAITGNVDVPLLGKDSFQEVDIVGITQPVVKHNFVVRDIEELEFILHEAFRIAGSGRKGPVLVDIPRDIQTKLCTYQEMKPADTAAPIQKHGDLQEALQAFAKSKRPYIYAGGGVVASGAQEELLEFSRRICAPVGLSMMGITALPASYQWNLGMCGMHGTHAAAIAESESDLLIALGVRFSERATGDIEAYRKNRTILHIDIDLSEIDKNIPSQIGICGDIKEVLRSLLAALPSRKNDVWQARVTQLKAMQNTLSPNSFSPKNIIEAVSRYCSADTLIATDVGQHQIWTMLYYPFEKPRTLLTSGGLGTMGYGLGAAIGGCIAMGGKKTVLFTSDGSFGMNLGELATAVSEELPIIIVILNNKSLGMVRQWQTMFYEGRYSQSTLHRKTDFAALAGAFGAVGYKAASLRELEEALQHAPKAGPIVIDCPIDIDEKVLPMIPPGGCVEDIITS